MCGITGIVSKGYEWNSDGLRSVIVKMTDAIAHRGPDDSGIWVDKKDRIALGNCGLSIIDLSAKGHQPMISSNGRYVFVYNGEVYNFLDLKRELDQQMAQIQWRSNCDTEVVLESINFWGVEKALASFNGMFAFALWDREEKKLILA